jgi:hypothetical protein
MPSLPSVWTKYQNLSGITILIPMDRLFDTFIVVDYWYHAFTCIPHRHWCSPNETMAPMGCHDGGRWDVTVTREWACRLDAWDETWARTWPWGVGGRVQMTPWRSSVGDATTWRRQCGSLARAGRVAAWPGPAGGGFRVRAGLGCWGRAAQGSLWQASKSRPHLPPLGPVMLGWR